MSRHAPGLRDMARSPQVVAAVTGRVAGLSGVPASRAADLVGVLYDPASTDADLVAALRRARREA